MSEHMATIGLDIGSSSTKCIVLDGYGSVTWTRSEPYRIYRGGDGEATLNPDDWLNAARTLLREAAAELGGRTPLGIGVTGPAHYAVLVDADGRSMGRAMLSSDARPAGVAEQLRDELGDAYFASTRVELTAGWTLAQLAWRRTQMSERWDRVQRVLVVKDYVRFAMTGVAATDASDAAGTGMYDQGSGTWSERWLEPTGFTIEHMPEIRPALSLGGGLDAEWARATGLPTGLPVAVGGTDTAAELVSVGALEAGAAVIKIASTGTVVVVTDRPIADRRLLAYPHVMPGRGYLLAATNTAATAYGWLRETVFGHEPEPPSSVYQEMDRLASDVDPGAGGLLFLPFLEGERTPFWDWRLRAGLVGLTSVHRREHFCRAVLEGVALSLRMCRTAVEESGVQVDRPVVSGGGTASRLWRDILVSTLDQECLTAEPQGPAVGAAMMARAAVEGSDLSMLEVKQDRRTIVPRDEWRQTYADLAEAYALATDALRPISYRLGEIAVSAAERREAGQARGRISK